MEEITPHAEPGSRTLNIAEETTLGDQQMHSNEDALVTSAINTNTPKVHVASNPLTVRLAFTVRETAELLGISEKSVRRLIARGLLRPSRALRHLMIPKKQIEKFLDATLAESTHEPTSEGNHAASK